MQTGSPSASPQFCCADCSHEWRAEAATEGCPACGERRVRLTNYLDLFGHAARRQVVVTKRDLEGDKP
jgi:hypothetical protein